MMVDSFQVLKPYTGMWKSQLLICFHINHFVHVLSVLHNRLVIGIAYLHIRYLTHLYLLTTLFEIIQFSQIA